jgi:DNA-directed RNA polymerase subunit alpha
MAILAFQKPDKVLMLEADNFFGKFEFRPLEPGYGVTIGNALRRRILLSSLEGFAISSIRVDGVKHEFATIPGVIGGCDKHYLESEEGTPKAESLKVHRV